MQQLTQFLVANYIFVPYSLALPTTHCIKSNYVASKKLLFSLFVAWETYCGGAWWLICCCDSFPILHRGLNFCGWLSVLLRSFTMAFAVTLLDPRPLPSASNVILRFESIKPLPSIMYGADSELSLKFVP